jgi:membrane fusion protein, multidrug efflux system
MRKNAVIHSSIIRYMMAIVAVVSLNACGKSADTTDVPAEARPVRVMILQGGAQGLEKAYPGKTEARDTVDVSFEIAGKIIELPVQRGMVVAAGDIIAKLDARDFENDYTAKRSEFEKALSELNRYRDLYEKDAVSRQDLETKERNKDVTEANLKIAEKKVQDSILKAPFPGVVATTYVDNFQSVQAKEPIALIQNNEAIEVVIYVPERDLAVMQESELKNAEAVFDAFPGQAFGLTLKEFETQADPVTQTFKVKFTLPQLENVKVLPGMSANVALKFQPKENQQPSSTFLLPSSAVQADATGKSFVWAVDEQQIVHRRDIEMGEITGVGSIQVKGGLEPGMVIVTAGVRELQEGMKVVPKTEAERIAE